MINKRGHSLQNPVAMHQKGQDPTRISMHACTEGERERERERESL